MQLLTDPSIPSNVLDRLDSYLPLPLVANDAPLPPLGSTAGRDGRLVPVAISTLPAYQRLGWSGASEHLFTRPEVNRRLVHAQASLPEGFGLVVLDAWRTVEFQRFLLESYAEIGDVSDYVADPDSMNEVPPHTTGGALDITLSWDAQPLRLGSDFDEFSERSWLRYFENESQEISTQRLRRLLGGTLIAHGFSPDPFEWWHFSFGDQAWARYFGLPHAILGQVTSNDEGSSR